MLRIPTWNETSCCGSSISESSGFLDLGGLAVSAKWWVSVTLHGEVVQCISKVQVSSHMTRAEDLVCVRNGHVVVT